MNKNIVVDKVVLDTTNEETYKESLSPMFDYDDEAAAASFDKNYHVSIGVNIEEVVKDIIHYNGLESYGYELHDLGNKKVLLIVASKDT